MALLGSHVFPRDTEPSGSPSSLSTGAVAGIAGGAGGVFLAAAGLFFIYWRRQRQFDHEDTSDIEKSGDYTHHRHRQRHSRQQVPLAAPAVAYTMDYKSDDPQLYANPGTAGSSSTYTFSPEKNGYRLSPAASPLDLASAMPTHPAYIPRAWVRGTSSPSSLGLSMSTASPPPFYSPPYQAPAAAAAHKTHPDDTVIQAFLRAANGETSPAVQHPQNHQYLSQPSAIRTRQGSASSSSSSTAPPLPPPKDQNPPLQSGGGQRKRPIPPPLNLNPILSNQSKIAPSAAAAVAAIPPTVAEGTILRLPGGSKPLPGREDTTISGPLAFPELHHHHRPRKRPRPSRKREEEKEHGRKGMLDDEYEDYTPSEDGYEIDTDDDDGDDDDDTYIEDSDMQGGGRVSDDEQQLSRQHQGRRQPRTYRSQSRQSQQRNRSRSAGGYRADRDGGGGMRSFRARALALTGEGDSGRERDYKGKSSSSGRHGRKRSDPNSGRGFLGVLRAEENWGGGGRGSGAYRRDYAESEVGRGTDIW
ncbi:hypothetical protein VTJ04DRAFT_6436 [Mycothermus thermophilus]|uniref:uncharacterized protein n=1 Tax=Humicola insolens TaxID=85995 RepID=UPI003743ACAD